MLMTSLQVDSGLDLLLTSSNGEGALDGGGAVRLLKVVGAADGTRVRLEKLNVRNGKVTGEHGGCMRVGGDGVLEMLGGTISGCEAVESNGYGGVRRCLCCCLPAQPSCMSIAIGVAACCAWCVCL